MSSDRRQFLKVIAAGAAGATLPEYVQGAERQDKAPKAPAQTELPRWRGFNLQYFFTAGRYSAPVEDDFRWVCDLGFDFIRLPMSYRIWTDGDDIYKIKEAPFGIIDSGRKDAAYEDFHGHKLDRKLLELLQEFE